MKTAFTSLFNLLFGLLFMACGLLAMGLGSQRVSVACQPLPLAPTVPTVATPQWLCQHADTWLWGVWVRSAGTLSGVTGATSLHTAGPAGRPQQTVALNGPGRQTALYPPTSGHVAAQRDLLQRLNTHLQGQQPFSLSLHFTVWFYVAFGACWVLMGLVLGWSQVRDAVRFSQTTSPSQ